MKMMLAQRKMEEVQTAYEELRWAIGERFPWDLPEFKERPWRQYIKEAAILFAAICPWIVLALICWIDPPESSPLFVVAVVSAPIAIILLLALPFRYLSAGDYLLGPKLRENQKYLPLRYRRATTMMLECIDTLPDLFRHAQWEFAERSPHYVNVRQVMEEVIAEWSETYRGGCWSGRIDFRYGREKGLFMELIIGYDGMCYCKRFPASIDGENAAIEWVRFIPTYACAEEE